MKDDTNGDSELLGENAVIVPIVMYRPIVRRRMSDDETPKSKTISFFFFGNQQQYFKMNVERKKLLPVIAGQGREKRNLSALGSYIVFS